MLLFIEFIIAHVYELPLFVITQMRNNFWKIYEETIVKRNYLYPLVEDFNKFKMVIFHFYDIRNLPEIHATWADYKVRFGIYILYFSGLLMLLCIILILWEVFGDYLLAIFKNIFLFFQN